MAAESRKQVPVLVGLLLLLGAVLWWQVGGSGSGPTRPAPRAASRPAARQGSGASAASPSTADVFARGVALARLTEDRPAPEGAGRDPFRAPSAAPSSPPVGPVTPPPKPVPPGTSGPAAPPPLAGPPPIVVKFIGVVSRQDVGKVAVLSDGKNVYYGRAGDIVDGRWRIVSIGEESLQIEYADGRGRQTVRLTG